jgi:hypothetical protein
LEGDGRIGRVHTPGPFQGSRTVRQSGTVLLELRLALLVERRPGVLFGQAALAGLADGE